MFTVEQVKDLCQRSHTVKGRAGILVKGSKQLLADEIVACLPPADVFIDCFGGGASIAMTALRSGKYKRVIYNEKAPILYECVRNTVKGDYYNNFVPFVNFEDYKTTTDARAKICFSFNGLWWTYGYRASHVPIVEALHYWLLDGTKIPSFDILSEIHPQLEETECLRHDVWKHIQVVSRIVCEWMGDKGEFESYNKNGGNFRLVHLLRQKSLNAIYETVQKYGSVECYNLDYRELAEKFSNEDVVLYCDPPYKSVTGYQSSKGIPFDYDIFLEWCKDNSGKVFISERAELPFQILWSKTKNAGVTTVDRRIATEYLYHA